MVISFLYWKIRWLSETESTVNSRFEILTVLLVRRALRCTRGPGSLGCLTFGWPWEDAHTCCSSFAPELGKDPHSEPLPGYPWGTY